MGGGRCGKIISRGRRRGENMALVEIVKYNGTLDELFGNIQEMI